MREKGALLRYTGEGVRSVPEVGSFARGTVAFVPRALALELLAGGDFEVVEPWRAVKVVLRVGQADPPPPAAPEGPGEESAGAR